MITYDLTTHADRQLRKLPIDLQRRIIKKIKFYIATDNPLYFADSIKGEAGKIYRFRIGNWRVICDWIDKNGGHIQILTIKPRPHAY